MKLSKLCLLLIAGVAFATAATASAASTDNSAMKIGVANPAHIFNEMQETKSLQAKMSDDQKRFAGDQQQKVKEIEALKAQRDGLDPKHPQYEQLNEALSKKTIEYKVWAESEKARAEHNQKRQMKALFAKIEAAVEEVAKRDGIDVVVADQRDPLPDELDQLDIRQLRVMLLQRNVMYTSARADMSQAVLTLLDAKYKSAGAVGMGK